MGPRVPLLLLAMVATCDRPTAPQSSSAPTVSACPKAPASPSTVRARAPSVPIRRDPAADAKRAAHFGAATAMRAALVHDDLAGFRASAARLSDADLSAARRNETWRPQLEPMRTAARRARDAKSLESGAHALTDVAQACAGCHLRLGVPDVELDVSPADQARTASGMFRHAWAADRLWDGLAIPSEVAWTTGAAVFANAPLEPAEIGGSKRLAAEVGKLADQAHGYGTQAAVATDAPARAKVLSDVFATCVECHATLQVGKGI